MTSRSIMGWTAACVVLSAGLGLYWKGRAEGAAGERSKVVAARAQAAVAGLEAAGERLSAQRVDVVVRQREAADETVTQLTQDAMTSEDAHAPLPADRAARLRAHDDELCRIAPALGAAPQLQMPLEAARPCAIHRLPDHPTQADLELGYAARGSQIVACDAARRLAVETHAAEHTLEAEAQASR
jgi:predicted secreted protein